MMAELNIINTNKSFKLKCDGNSSPVHPVAIANNKMLVLKKIGIYSWDVPYCILFAVLNVLSHTNKILNLRLCFIGICKKVILLK